MHDCQQDKIIQQLLIDVAVAKSDISTVKNEITGIKETLKQFNWWFVSLLATGILSLLGTVAGLIINQVFKK